MLTLLALKKKREATELIVKDILQKQTIYTTRDDEKAEMWIYHEGIYIPQARTFIKTYCREILGDAVTSTITNEVIFKIETDTYTDPVQFFRNKYVYKIAVDNGILNILDKTIEPFTPDKIFFNKIPVKYEPGKECPSIIKHLTTILKNKEDIPVMQELFGFLLLKEYKIEKSIYVHRLRKKR